MRANPSSGLERVKHLRGRLELEEALELFCGSEHEANKRGRGAHGARFHLGMVLDTEEEDESE